MRRGTLRARFAHPPNASHGLRAVPMPGRPTAAGFGSGAGVGRRAAERPPVQRRQQAGGIGPRHRGRQPLARSAAPKLANGRLGAVGGRKRCGRRGGRARQAGRSWGHRNGCMGHKAAEQGNARAHARLDELYGLGCGVDRDVAAAVGWYREAGEQGNFKS